jgi:hypothetical protein
MAARVQAMIGVVSGNTRSPFNEVAIRRVQVRGEDGSHAISGARCVTEAGRALHC